MKRGKEIDIESFKNYNIVSGNVDNKNSKSLYINLSTWGQPELNDNINYVRVISDINKKIKKSVYSYLSLKDINNEFLKNRTIVDLDIRESGIKFNKRSFLNVEITLFLLNETPITSSELRPKIDDLTKLLVNDVFEKNMYFVFHKTKKN